MLQTYQTEKIKLLIVISNRIP